MSLVVYESYIPAQPSEVFFLLEQGTPLPELLPHTVVEPRQSVRNELWTEVRHGYGGICLKHYQHLTPVPGGSLLRDELVVARGGLFGRATHRGRLRRRLAMRHRALRLLVGGHHVPLTAPADPGVFSRLPFPGLHGHAPFALLLSWRIDDEIAHRIRPPPLRPFSVDASYDPTLVQLVLVRRGLPLPWAGRLGSGSQPWAESWLMLPSLLDPERQWSLPEAWEIPGLPASPTALRSRARRTGRIRAALHRREWSGPRVAALPVCLESNRTGRWSAMAHLDPFLTGAVEAETLRWPRAHGGEEDGGFFNIVLSDPDGGPSLAFSGGPGPDLGPLPPAWGPPHLVQSDPLRDRLRLLPFHFTGGDPELSPVAFDRCDPGPRARRFLGDAPKLLGAWALAPGGLFVGSGVLLSCGDRPVPGLPEPLL